MRERVGFIKKPEQVKNAEAKYEDSMPQWRGGTTEDWACTRHWRRANREANRFCACPLPVHSNDIYSCTIPERFHKMFDRIGREMSGYRPGLRWCCRCRNKADEVFKSEKDYLPPEQVSLC